MGEWALAVVGNVVIAAVMAWMVWAVEKDQLPRQGLVGIRTGATLHSDVAWRAGHRAALGVMRAAVWVSVLGGVATIALATRWNVAAGVVWGASMAGILGLALWSAVVASRAARAADPTY